MTWQAYDQRLSGKITEEEFCQVIQNIHSGFDTDADVKSAESEATTKSRLVALLSGSVLLILIIIVVLAITEGGLNNASPVAMGIVVALAILLVVLVGSCSAVMRIWHPRIDNKCITAYRAVVSRETAAWQARGISTTYYPRSHAGLVNDPELGVVAAAMLRISV